MIQLVRIYHMFFLSKGRGAFSDFTQVPAIKPIKSRYLGLQTIFSAKSFLVQAKRSLTVPSFKALAVLFSDLQNSGYVKPHNVALPFNLTTTSYINSQKSVNL